MNGGPATWHVDQLVPITRNGQMADVFWTYSYSPIDDIDGPSGVGGVLVVVQETTSAIGRSRRQEVILTLGESLRSLRDLPSIQAAAARAVCLKLNASRAGFGEVFDDDTIVLTSAHCAGLSPLLETIPFSRYGAAILARQRASARARRWRRATRSICPTTISSGCETRGRDLSSRFPCFARDTSAARFSCVNAHRDSGRRMKWRSWRRSPRRPGKRWSGLAPRPRFAKANSVSAPRSAPPACCGPTTPKAGWWVINPPGRP